MVRGLPSGSLSVRSPDHVTVISTASPLIWFELPGSATTALFPIPRARYNQIACNSESPCDPCHHSTNDPLIANGGTWSAGKCRRTCQAQYIRYCFSDERFTEIMLVF